MRLKIILLVLLSLAVVGCAKQKEKEAEPPITGTKNFVDPTATRPLDELKRSAPATVYADPVKLINAYWQAIGERSKENLLPFITRRWQGRLFGNLQSETPYMVGYGIDKVTVVKITKWCDNDWRPDFRMYNVELDIKTRLGEPAWAEGKNTSYAKLKKEDGRWLVDEWNASPGCPS